MALIQSISGIRGTIGGVATEGLSPQAIQQFAIGYARWVLAEHLNPKVVVARDARMSGEMVYHILAGTLMACGVTVINLGLETTPTTEMAVVDLQAQGGIILTASHNPKHWNALKLLNAKGEFLSAADGEKVLEFAKDATFSFPEVGAIGKIEQYEQALETHIQHILNLKTIDVDTIRSKQYTVVVDAINSIGARAVPALLKALGCKEVIVLNADMHGDFEHNPEPLPENLGELMQAVKAHKADLGIAVDPDVDRLAFVTEKGEWFGEEYTLVAVADYITQLTPGPTVSNLSSTKALKELTEAKGLQYEAAAVGEVNVVSKMKAIGAVIGGEGNGGIIYPELHYGRDALVGIACILSDMATHNIKLSHIRQRYPFYHIAKKKVDLELSDDMDLILKKLSIKYKEYPQNTEDGLKLHINTDWVHIRKSNTEPIMRIYIESDSHTIADSIGNRIIDDIQTIRETV